MSHSWPNQPVSELMHRPLILKDSALLSDALASLQTPDAHCILVINESGALSGFFTEEDVLKKVVHEDLAPSTTIGSLVDSNYFTLKEDAPFSQVIDTMGQNLLRYVPLVDEDKKPKGIFSIRGLIDFLAEIVQKKEGNPSESIEHAILDVLGLPISFSLSAYGQEKCIRLSCSDQVGLAIERFKKSSQHAALIYNNRQLEGLLRLKDIPYKALHSNTQMEELPLSDFMTKTPVQIEENESIGSSIVKMSESEILYLSYSSANKELGLLSAEGLISYIYNHIYDDS